VACQDTEHFQVTRNFPAKRERRFEALLLACLEGRRL